MKLTENIEVKANRVVFDKETVYELENKTDDFAGIWCRTKSDRKTDIGGIENQKMAYNLNRIANTDQYRIRIVGETINVYTRAKERNAEFNIPVSCVTVE